MPVVMEFQKKDLHAVITTRFGELLAPCPGLLPKAHIPELIQMDRAPAGCQAHRAPFDRVDESHIQGPGAIFTLVQFCSARQPAMQHT
jgi:hypothetical protein